MTGWSPGSPEPSLENFTVSGSRLAAAHPELAAPEHDAPGEGGG
ncbi:hypothetical protein [Streptomyces badius]|nr:hypothetical protein [Streptomyces badius]